MNLDQLTGRGAILYFFTQRGCVHCGLQRPIVDQFRRATTGKVFVYELDAEKHDGIDGWSPKGTPAFGLKIGGILMATAEGQMTLAQMEKFVERGASGKGVDNENPTRRRRSRPKRDRDDAPDKGEDLAEDDEQGPEERTDV